MTVPTGLDRGGRALWRDITKDRDLDPMQRVQLLEACRAKDRLDKLDAILRGDADTWTELQTNEGTGATYIVVNAALDKANNTANLMKQLLAAMRLPDEDTGKRPQHRGGARGAQRPTVPGGKVTPISALERAQRTAGQ
jgi:hypothetical protein